MKKVAHKRDSHSFYANTAKNWSKSAIKQKHLKQNMEVRQSQEVIGAKMKDLKLDPQKSTEEKEVKKYELDDFEHIETIGKGTFGYVKLVQHIPTSNFYAMKIIQKDTIEKNKNIEHIMNEKKILKKLTSYLNTTDVTADII